MGCRLPAQVTTLWMGSMFAAMSSLEGHLEVAVQAVLGTVVSLECGR